MDIKKIRTLVANLSADRSGSIEINNEGGLLMFATRWRGQEAFIGRALIDGATYDAAVWRQDAAAWRLALFRGQFESVATLSKTDRAANPKLPYFQGRVELAQDFFGVSLWVKPTRNGGFFLSGVATPEVADLFRDFRTDGDLVTAAIHQGGILADIAEAIHDQEEGSGWE